MSSCKSFTSPPLPSSVIPDVNVLTENSKNLEAELEERSSSRPETALRIHSDVLLASKSLSHILFYFGFGYFDDQRDGVVVGASASQLLDLGSIPLVESYQKTLKNGIYSFPAWRSAFVGGCGEQAGKFACCVLGQDT